MPDIALPGLRAMRPAAPAEARTSLRDLPVLLLVLVLMVLLVWLASADPFTLNMLATTILVAGLATAWNIIGGIGGQFSLGHSVFFAVGAYTAANLYLRADVSLGSGFCPARPCRRRPRRWCPVRCSGCAGRSSPSPRWP